MVALEAEGVDPGGEVGIVVFGWYNYITEVCHFWDFSFGKGFDARGTSCILLSGLNVNSSQSMHSQHLAWRFHLLNAKDFIATSNI